MLVQRVDMQRKRDPQQNFARDRVQMVIFVPKEVSHVKCSSAVLPAGWHQQDTHHILNQHQYIALVA